MRTDIEVGMIIEGCNLHIGEVVSCDPKIGDVTYVSMFDGVTYNCDLYHCGVYQLDEEEIKRKITIFREGGMAAIAKLYLVENYDNA
jgi:hypothetical protein